MYDLFVIGGGINGAGVARDAAGRGLKVGLAERDDLAGHTSSASTKLIHGGLRYLEHGALKLVRESLIERATLMRAAPHLVRPLKFVLPHHEGLRPAWLLRLGLLLYDHLGDRPGGGPRLPPSASVRLDAPPFAGQLESDFKTGLAYSDCQVDDARLVVLNALDAAERGADVMTRAECVALARDGDAWTITLTSAAGVREVRARAVVNAAGPWAGELAGRTSTANPKPGVRLVKGAHIVTRRLYPGEHAFLFQNTDKRVVFAIPYERDFTLIGTTETPLDDPRRGETATPDEVAYLCDAVSGYLARPVTPADVVWSFAGVRALAASDEADASRVSREDALVLDADGPPLLTIAGGKLTTHRKVAERALAKLASAFPFLGAPWTARATLPGGDIDAADIDRFERLCRVEFAWVPPPLMRRLARSYGARVRDVLGDATAMPGLGRHFGAGLFEREVAYLAAREFAQTAEDVLWRRSKLGLRMDDGERRAVDEWLAGERGGGEDGMRAAI